MYYFDVMTCYGTHVSAIHEGTLAIRGYGPKSGITDASPCLSRLLHAIHQIPLSVPEASSDHPFAQFSGELKGSLLACEQVM